MGLHDFPEWKEIASEIKKNPDCNLEIKSDRAEMLAYKMGNVNVLAALFHCVRDRIYPPPELLIYLSNLYADFIVGKGKVNFDDLVFGKPKKGIGNFSAEFYSYTSSYKIYHDYYYFNLHYTHITLLESLTYTVMSDRSNDLADYGPELDKKIMEELRCELSPNFKQWLDDKNLPQETTAEIFLEAYKYYIADQFYEKLPPDVDSFLRSYRRWKKSGKFRLFGYAYI